MRWSRLLLFAACALALLLHADVLVLLRIRPKRNGDGTWRRRRPPTSPVSRLRRLEAIRSSRWNKTAARVLVLGQKTARDFGVYSWAFSVHGFKVSAPKLGVFLLTDLPRRRPVDTGVGALLCHSLFLSNCVRPLDRQAPGTQSQGAIFDRLRGMRRHVSRAHPQQPRPLLAAQV